MKATSFFPTPPEHYVDFLAETKRVEFTMASNEEMGSLLKTLVASKPKGHFLEIGTGTGHALAWMVEGMDKASSIISIDNDPKWMEHVLLAYQNDTRVKLLCTDGGAWLDTYQGKDFDLVFADAWPGKYSHLDLLLDRIKVGGFYIIDDMLPQSNWPKGHDKKVQQLLADLRQRKDFSYTQLDWSTGVVVMVKKEVN